MEENKGVLNKIKEIFNRIFGKKNIKQLPPPVMVIEQNPEKKNSLDKYKLDNKEMEKNEMNIDSKNYLEQIAENFELLEEQQLEEMINNFSIPTDLRGYSFRTDISTDNYIDMSMNKYVCYLSKDNAESLENTLLICMTESKNKATIIENTLSKLKRENDNTELINTIKNEGFKDNDNSKFEPAQDFHLNILLEKLSEAKIDNIHEITIPIYYEYVKTPKGYIIRKTYKLKELEQEDLDR